jgi:integrase
MSLSINNFTYDQAITLRNESTWRELAQISISEAANYFLNNLSYHTKLSYRYALNIFFNQNLIDPFCTLQQFSLFNLDALLDNIKMQIKGTEATKQARCACFISFTKFLYRKTQGMIKMASPCKDHGLDTFKKIRSTSVTKALKEKEMTFFLKNLKEYSFRDYLIAKTILQGAKRVEEVLSAKINQIKWNENIITFKQSKADQLEKFTYINYPEYFFKELKEYIQDRPIDDFIFVTNQGKKIDKFQIYRSFVITSQRAEISIKVTPHVLRASAITMLSKRGYSAEQIMLITGHNSMNSVIYYNKTPMEDNISKEVSLIGIG